MKDVSGVRSGRRIRRNLLFCTLRLRHQIVPKLFMMHTRGSGHPLKLTVFQFLLKVLGIFSKLPALFWAAFKSFQPGFSLFSFSMFLLVFCLVFYFLFSKKVIFSQIHEVFWIHDSFFQIHKPFFNFVNFLDWRFSKFLTSFPESQRSNVLVKLNS